MADESSGGKSKRVFISYSHEPVENADFVRSLAVYLRKPGFQVWLDEEEISAGGDIEEQIKAGARASDVGLFVVTARWLERDRNYIRHEVSLFGNSGARRLAILRDRADIADLGPHFATVKSLEWFPDDPQPFARLWEVYCGITGDRPGARAEWEGKGRRIFGGGDEPRGPAPGPCKPETGRQDLPGTGKPIAWIGGGDWTYLVTDRDEWAGIRADGALHPPIRPCPGYAVAAASKSNELLVAGYEATIGRLRGQQWETLEQESPVLCIAAGSGGTFAGTAGGAVISLDAQPAKPLFRMRDPVAALAPYEGGLLALGTRGMFCRVAWPVVSRDPMKWISAGGLGRPIGFFAAVEFNNVGVHSATRIGVLDPETEGLVVCPKIFDEGIRSIAFLGAQVWPYAILTDAGNLFMMDASLNNTSTIRFPRGVTVAGCTGAGWTGPSLAWTNEGRLYRVSAHGAPEAIAEQDVVMAYCPTGVDGIHVVRWGGGHATVELLRAH